MGDTNILEIVDIPAHLLSKLQSSQIILSLLTDNPTADPETTDIMGTHLFDYDYVTEDTNNQVMSYICVDTDIEVSPRNRGIKNIDLYVYVICHRANMKLDASKFPGRKGNRRDNIVCEIHKLIGEDINFGVGKLLLYDVVRFHASDKYVGKTMIYKIPSISKGGR